MHIKVIKKAYPRYYIFRYRQHYSFAYGVLIAFVIIKLLGMFVWKVNFNGNYVYTDEYLKSYIKDMKFIMEICLKILTVRILKNA